jgi:hypothetical protein
MRVDLPRLNYDAVRAARPAPPRATVVNDCASIARTVVTDPADGRSAAATVPLSPPVAVVFAGAPVSATSEAATEAARRMETRGMTVGDLHALATGESGHEPL